MQDSTAIERPSLLARAKLGRWHEDILVVIGAFLLTLQAEWRMIVDPLVHQSDARLHEFWMRRWQDPELLHDPLTDALLATGYSPPGFRLVYWLASHVVDPVLFGELLPLVLAPLAVWLVFRIVRDQAAWSPAAWIAAALFLVPWDIQRFSGGHPRAFAQPIVLLVVLLLLRRQDLAAAFVPLLGFLLYPPAGVAALAILLLAALERTRPPFVNPERALCAVLGGVGFAVAALVTRLVSGADSLVTEAQAHRYPEFGPNGQMRFFAASTLDYLTQNYSGFNLHVSGSILAVAAVVLLVIRPRNAKLLRWEVWCMPIAALALFGIAHALLFRLYLPHRYTYPLLPFFCIVIGVTLRPTLEAWGARGRAVIVPALALVLPLLLALLALTVFPFGPLESASAAGSWLLDASPYLALALAVGLLVAVVLRARAPAQARARAIAAGAAVVAGAILVGEVAFAGGGQSPASVVCENKPLYRYLRKLPKDAIIAGDPIELDCIPFAARRPVVISSKLYQPWDKEYFRMIRERMSLAVKASYGPSRAPILELRDRYGADYLLVSMERLIDPWPGREPFTGQLEHLLDTVEKPAAWRLPADCRTWRRRPYSVYDLDCVAAETSP